CWPSVNFDAGAIANALSPLLPAGFYYKTFMWPPTPRWWLKYEHVIRRAAGMGRAAESADPDRYEHQYAHCDVLVIGGGPAGLAAARVAAATGARVIVCQQTHRFGGDAAADWRAETLAAIAEPRPQAHADGALVERVRAAGVAIHGESVIRGARGRRRVSGVEIVSVAGGASTTVACDLVALSGGFSPAVHLFSQARGSLAFDDASASFLPNASPLPIVAAGAARGRFEMADAIADGAAAVAVGARG